MNRNLGLVISPTAGNGRGVTVGREAARRLEAAGCHVIPLGAPTIDDTNSIIRRAINDRMIDGIVTIGGDGTVHLAIQHLVGTDLFLGHIPFGTGNDIARDMGNRKISNLVMLGAFVAQTGLFTEEEIVHTMHHVLGGKEDMMALNEQAIKEGIAYIKDQK